MLLDLDSLLGEDAAASLAISLAADVNLLAHNIAHWASFCMWDGTLTIYSLPLGSLFLRIEMRQSLPSLPLLIKLSLFIENIY